jgi:TrmH family RNA methyltransferase
VGRVQELRYKRQERREKNLALRTKGNGPRTTDYGLKVKTLSKSKLQYLRSLSQRKIRERDGVFLVEGWHSLEEACAVLKEIQILVHTKQAGENPRFAPVLRSAQPICHEEYEASTKEFSLVADTVTSQGVAAVVKKFSASSDNELEKLLKGGNDFVVALDQVGDPGNLGAIVRTSDWFGVDAILLSQNSVELYNPKVVRSTMGSIFHLPILEFSDGPGSFAEALSKLRRGGFKLYGAQGSGTSDIRTMTWPKKSVLVIGNEARGISPEISRILDEHVAIPKFGKAESLNAGVAVGVFLAHRSFQLKK